MRAKTQDGRTGHVAKFDTMIVEIEFDDGTSGTYATSQVTLEPEVFIRDQADQPEGAK